MIIEKSYQIEANMDMGNTINRNIDLSVIEDLKRRRGEQRLTGQELDMQRERIIKQVQSQILSEQQKWMIYCAKMWFIYFIYKLS